MTIKEGKSHTRDSVFRRCILEYGANSQIDMAIEEMAELAKALLKLRRGQGESQNLLIDDVIEEIADVHIMLMQLLDNESDKVEVSCIVHKKLKRQIRRIKRESL